MGVDAIVRDKIYTVGIYYIVVTSQVLVSRGFMRALETTLMRPSRFYVHFM